jgi:hypothetical protein
MWNVFLKQIRRRILWNRKNCSFYLGKEGEERQYKENVKRKPREKQKMFYSMETLAANG